MINLRDPEFAVLDGYRLITKDGYESTFRYGGYYTVKHDKPEVNLYSLCKDYNFQIEAMSISAILAGYRNQIIRLFAIDRAERNGTHFFDELPNIYKEIKEEEQAYKESYERAEKERMDKLQKSRSNPSEQAGTDKKD